LGTESISSDLIRGHIDMLVLQILRSQDSYGYEIIKAIAVRRGFGLWVTFITAISFGSNLCTEGYI
jgi:hypothetical protein